VAVGQATMGSVGVSLKGRKVLVTGAGGFIGRRLVSSLAAVGARVCAAARADLLPFAAESDGTIDWQHLDVTDSEEADELVSAFAPEVIYHLAAAVDGDRSAGAMLRQAQVTLGGTINLALAAARHGNPLFIQLGTCEEYGLGPTPFREEQAPAAISPYSAAKASATQFLGAAGRSFDLPVIILRASVVYGPGQKKLLIPYLFDCYLHQKTPDLTAGEQTRDFLYVDDLIEALVSSGERQDLAGRIINIASGEKQVIKDVARMVADLCCYEGDLGLGRLPYRQAEGMQYVASRELALELLNWEPKTSFSKGLAQTAEWWRSSP